MLTYLLRTAEKKRRLDLANGDNELVLLVLNNKGVRKEYRYILDADVDDRDFYRFLVGCHWGSNIDDAYCTVKASCFMGLRFPVQGVCYR